jgi:hypothetical protein
MEQDLEYLLSCVEAHADKFPVPEHMRQLVARIRVQARSHYLKEAAKIVEAYDLGPFGPAMTAFIDLMKKDMARCIRKAAREDEQ